MLSHLQRLAADPRVGVLLMLGEVGGDQELHVAEAVRAGALTKPLVAWGTGTAGDTIAALVTALRVAAGDAGDAGEAQFGHAGACANNPAEKAEAKNAVLPALLSAGHKVLVPDCFEELPVALLRAAAIASRTP